MQLQIKINPASDLELRRQLYHEIRRQIGNNLQPGQKMPSSRELADQIGVSRKTVKEAYRQLITEGFLQATLRSATYVSSTMGGPSPKRSLKKKTEATASAVNPVLSKLSDYGKRVVAQDSKLYGANAADMSFFSWQPEFNAFPIGQLQALLLSEFKRSLLTPAETVEHPFGLVRLREQIAEWALSNREIPCAPEQVVIISGYGQALDLITRIHCVAGDVVALEDPTFPPPRQLFRSYGAKILPIAVDEQGLRVKDLTTHNRSPKVKLVLVTPAHQFPLGCVLTMDRRVDLLRWARQAECLVLEDDYDAEFNFQGQPVPALSALSNHCVLYLGSFKKVLPTPFNLDFMIIPHRLTPVYEQALRLCAGQISPVIQSALANFMAAGELDRLVRKLRTNYRRKRQTLLSSLNSYMGKNAEIVANNVGLHVVMRIKSSLSDDECIELAAKAGLELISTRMFFAEARDDTSEFVLGYATLPEEQISSAIKRLGQAFKKHK